MIVPKPKKQRSGMWYIQLRLGGENIMVHETTAKKCTKAAQFIKAEYLAGKRVPVEPKIKKLPTLSEAIDSYIEKRDAMLSPATIGGYRVIQKNRLKGLMGKSLSDISDSEWMKAFNAEAKIVSAKTLRNTWGLIRAVIVEETEKQPPKVKMPQAVPHDKKFLDPDQVKVFVQAVKGEKVEIPALLALSSLRKSEILALRWENIDLEKRIIKVRGAAVFDEHGKIVQKKENKNSTSNRNVPIMMSELYDALCACPDKDGCIVKGSPNALYEHINRICRENGLPEVGVHGLRHSFASLAYHLGVPERVTMEIGGWSNNQTMHKIYIHIARQDVQKYADEFKDFFSSAADPAGE